MKKERLAHGWSLREFAARTGIDFTTVSRIENGRRPPTAKVAAACDGFPGRTVVRVSTTRSPATGARSRPASATGQNSKSKPAGWTTGGRPSCLGCSRPRTTPAPCCRPTRAPAATPSAARLANRMERQRRVLMREDPPAAWFMVDEMALYRRVGSPEVMAAQMRHLSDVAALPTVTVQVLPAVAHPANASGFIIAGDSAWCEHVKGGYVYTGEPVTPLLTLFDTLRGECYRVSESAALLERMAGMDPWRKSSYSDANGGACAEVAGWNGVILVRDTTNRDGATLSFTAAAWQAFTASTQGHPPAPTSRSGKRATRQPPSDVSHSVALRAANVIIYGIG